MFKRPDLRQPERAPASLVFALAALIPMVAMAQSPTGLGNNLTPEIQANTQIVDVVRRLQESNQTTAVETIRKQLERTSCHVSLPPVGAAKLTVEEIRQRAQQAHLRLGWVYQCMKCDQWHVNLCPRHPPGWSGGSTHHTCIVRSGLRWT